MTTPIPFVSLKYPTYGVIERLSPKVRRIIARNPGPFTYTGTGTYIVGEGSVAVIDPGPLDQTHIDALLGGLGQERISHLLITHTHNDHSPAARRLDAPTYGFGRHGATDRGEIKVEEGGDLDFKPDHRLRHGDIVAGDGWTIEALHTPGHTSNHLCFALREEQALFTGDHVMGWSTTVISPPDGDMGAYLKSLDAVLSRGDRILYPTHGAPVAEPQPLLRALIAHRHEREAQILEILAEGPQDIASMVAVIYSTVDKRLHPAAARSVEAHLIRMIAEGRIVKEGERYRIA